MALMSEESSATSAAAAAAAAAATDIGWPGREPSKGNEGKGSSADSSRSVSPNVDKGGSVGGTVAPASGGGAPLGVATPSLPTKRTVRELLETRNTPSKMEIGQGVLLMADITGAELVIIRGCFEGTVKAQCIDIEQGAEVKGTIECEAARVNGKFDGVFVSSHSLHLASHANVSGRIVYRRLKVAKGAQIYGHSEYRSPVLSKT